MNTDLNEKLKQISKELLGFKKKKKLIFVQYKNGQKDIKIW